MFDQVGDGTPQALRVIAELSEAGVTGATDQTSEQPARVTVIDMETLPFADLCGGTVTNLATLSTPCRPLNSVELACEPELPNAPAQELRCVLFRVTSLPVSFSGQDCGFPLRGLHGAGVPAPCVRRLTFAATRSRFRVRSRTDTECGDRTSSTTPGTNARLTDLVPACHAELRDIAFQASAAAGARVIPDPLSAPVVFSPAGDAPCTETALETLFRRRRFASPAPRAAVIELPVAIWVQSKPTIGRDTAPSKRFHGRTGAAGHHEIDGGRLERFNGGCSA